MQEQEVRAHLKEAEEKQMSAHVELKGINVDFALTNAMSYYRVTSLHTKEPETLAWALSLGPDDVLFDVGANMGLFTVIAAKVSGAQVFAFEPESQNYSLLNKNIFINKITDKACAYCVAITEKFKFDKLFLSGFSFAGSCHQFGAPVDYNLVPHPEMLGQGCVGVSIDQLVESGFPFPSYIKIDVDGFEHAVIAGASNVLADRRLKSVLLEVNKSIPQHVKMFDVMKGHGFVFDEAQMSESNCGHRVNDPKFNQHYNVIFTRPA